MLKILNNQLVTVPSIGVSTFGQAMSMRSVYTMSVLANITVNAFTNPVVPAASVNTTTGVWTSTAHKLVQGQLVTLTTSVLLPSGFSLATTYFVIFITANTFALASSAANALAGTPIIPTTQGTGDHTVVQTALATGAFAIQKSNDGITNWVNDGTPATVSSTGLQFQEKAPVTSAWMRWALTLASGSVSALIYPCLICDEP